MKTRIDPANMTHGDRDKELIRIGKQITALQAKLGDDNINYAATEAKVYQLHVWEEYIRDLQTGICQPLVGERR